jgi:hypothetical protein
VAKTSLIHLDPSNPVSKPVSDAEFKQKLKRRRYSAPAIDKMMDEYSAATDDAKKVLSDKLLTDDPAKRTANNDEYKAKVQTGANPPDGPTPSKPKSDDEFKAALEKAGYRDPALGEMMKVYKAAGTDEAKKALSAKLLVADPTQRGLNKKEYAALAAADSPSGGGAMSKSDLDAELKKLGYNDAARKRMLDEWEKETDPTRKKAKQAGYLNAANKSRYEKRYNDSGKLDVTSEMKASLDGILKTRGYDDATRKKMIAAWEAAKNVDRDKLYPEFVSEDPAQIAKNKVDYGSGGAGPPPPTDTSGECWA